MAVLLSLHVLAAIIWVGGMFFALNFLRPAAVTELEPPERLKLWKEVFARFFLWVWAAVIVLLVTGHIMIMLYGGMEQVNWHITTMMRIAYVMAALFVYLYFVPYKKLVANVEDHQWPEAGQALNTIRKIVTVNVWLGLLVALIASAGRFV